MNYVDRDVGQIPISIGTSLALEGLLGIHPNQPKQPPSEKMVRHIWISLSTLTRNMYAAMTKETLRTVKPKDVYEMIIQEMEIIPDALRQRGCNHRVVYYISDLGNIDWTFPHALWITPNTERQKNLDKLHKVTLSMALHYLDENQVPYRTIKRKPQASEANVAILTHYPHELLWRFQFGKLLLLESHTGKLKTYTNWHTKLNGLKHDDIIPFNRLTLQLFGDGTLIKQQSKAIRDEIKQLAVQRNWTVLTTMTKVTSDINNYGSPDLKKTCSILYD